MKKYKLFSIIFIFILACNPEEIENESNLQPTQEDGFSLSDNQLSGTDINTGKLEKRLFTDKMICSGNIEPTPQGLAYITSPYGGFIKTLDRYIGEEIKKGEVLFTMENPDFIEMQEHFLNARAELVYLEKEYVRQRELKKDNATSGKVFEQAERNYLKAKAFYQAQKAKINLLGLDPEKIKADEISAEIDVISPIKGYVSDIKGNIGEFVLPEDVILEITDPERLHLHLKIFEKDIDKVYAGQLIEFNTLADPGKEYKAVVFSPGHTINPEDHTITVHARLESINRNLIPGLFINAEISIESDSLYAIPREGIIMGEENSFVFILKSGKYYKIPVETGPEEDNYFSLINPPQNILENPVVLKGAYFINAAIEGSEEE